MPYLSAFMKRYFAKIFIISVLTLLSPFCLSAAKGWESVRSERLSEAKVVSRTSDVEVRSQRGVILISTSRPVQVKVFSILGQLVSHETVPVGVSQLVLNTHGLFIVKIGDMTCKVAL